ncbi:putative RNA-binding protein 46-like [Tropilaelaps mercedesae]|uniref:Putative RNA-binding protein 46-like n=1 Tax=Tropilaelaps mercedesae TaxID=418985 RepID=A0A1V9XBX4_9ACAR|nr:putative RNA-binding protein 46-like [Tropilaelaps mercedesae]
MAAVDSSRPETRSLQGFEEVRAVLREFPQFEVVLDVSAVAFRLRGIVESNLENASELHVTGIPNGTPLSQVALLFLGRHGISDSLLSLTLQLDAKGASNGEAVAIYESKTDAANAELELNGLSFPDDSSKGLKVRRLREHQSSSTRPNEGRPWPVRSYEGYRKVFEGVYCPTNAKDDIEKKDGPHPPEMSRRLYVANIPKSKTQPEILEYFRRCFLGVTDVILYAYPGSERSRGFCFVEFSSVKCAMIAKEAIVASRPWGCNVVADWADPEYEPDEEVMKTVKVLYLKNIASTTTENDIRRAIEMRGVQVERVKVIRDFGFVHFVTRGRAEAALEVCKDLELHGQRLQVCWAKPPPDKHMREEVLRNRERRMWCFQAARGDGCCTQHSLFGSDPLHTSGYQLNAPSCRFAGCTGNRGRGDY